LTALERQTPEGRAATMRLAAAVIRRRRELAAQEEAARLAAAEADASREALDDGPKPFTLEHWKAWTAQLVLDSGKLMVTEPFQDAFVADVFAGFQECWFVVPEGSAKTTLAAALALYVAEFRPFAAIPVAAASREQAEIVYRQGEGFVLRTDRLKARVFSAIQQARGRRKLEVPAFVCLEGYRRINHVNGGRIQVYAADEKTGDGVIPDFAIIDEPHRQPDLSLYRTWAGKLDKRGGQLIAISTRGEPGSDFEETLTKIRESATDVVRDGSFTRYVSGRIVLHEWAVPEGADVDDMVVVKAANPLKATTIEALQAKHDSPTETRHHWLRFACNRPTRDVDAWLGEDGEKIWADLLAPYTFVLGAPTWAGVDVGIKRDSTCIVAVQRDEKGELHARARFWIPKPDEPVDVTDAMAYLRELATRYDLRAVSYDPKFFDVPAKMLADEDLPMIEIPQSVERMTTICGTLLEVIKRKGVHHNGDPELARQVLGAVARYNERGFTLHKSKSRGRIDGAIGLALSVDRAVQVEKAPKRRRVWSY